MLAPCPGLPDFAAVWSLSPCDIRKPTLFLETLVVQAQSVRKELSREAHSGVHINAGLTCANIGLLRRLTQCVRDYEEIFFGHRIPAFGFICPIESGEHANMCPLFPSLLFGQGVNTRHITHVTGLPHNKQGVDFSLIESLPL